MQFKHPDFEPFIESLQQKQNLSLTGLAGSSQALLCANSFMQVGNKQLIILPDKESAAFFYHDLETLLKDEEQALQDKKVHFFPSSFTRTFDPHNPDVTNLKLRSEIADKLISSQEPILIVSYPDAMIEKMASPTYLKENRFEIKKGEVVPPEIFLEFLYAFEYKQEDFVFEPGQFAWRGAIFDIFSYSEEYPFRIEFEEETIHNIRMFDPGTQLSVKEVDQIHIMPALTSGMNQNRQVSLFEFLDPETIIWVNEFPTIRSFIEHQWRNFEKQWNYDQGVPHFFLSGKQMEEELQRFQLLQIGSPLFIFFQNYDFKIKPQHHFNKNFDYLLEEWIDNLERGYETHFLSPNSNQHERIKKIMQDLLAEYNEAHHTTYEVEQLFHSQPITLHEGFRDEEGKLCVYTDHQFFEKYHRFVVRDRYKKSESFSLKELFDLQQGDYVVHVNYGIGIYEGLTKMEVNGKLQEAIQLTYKDGAQLYMSIHGLHKLSKYNGKEGTAPTLHKLGSSAWQRTKDKSKRRVKEMVIDLARLYAERKAKPGFAFSPDSYLQTELEASFMYEDTPDQYKTTQAVKADMEQDR
ncbi:MAG TPA: CarD family transcriptional regulator, partial [Bacteroidales bacterium]|nr:CarD family transcriptional regulator [Bacteroidales bacterium]